MLTIDNRVTVTRLRSAGLGRVEERLVLDRTIRAIGWTAAINPFVRLAIRLRPAAWAKAKDRTQPA
jgi:hypothetical protein